MFCVTFVGLALSQHPFTLAAHTPPSTVPVAYVDDGFVVKFDLLGTEPKKILVQRCSCPNSPTICPSPTSIQSNLWNKREHPPMILDEVKAPRDLAIPWSRARFCRHLFYLVAVESGAVGTWKGSNIKPQA